MKLIANETEYARRCLELGYIDKKQPYKSIRTIVRYLNKVCHITDINIIYSSILSYLEDIEKRVEIDIDIIRTMMNEDNPYNVLQRVFISKQEMDTITSMPYPTSWKKVLFVMLVQYKVKLQIYPEARNRRIEADLTTIMNDAHTTLSVAKRMEMLAQFEEDGLIEMPNGGKQAKYFYLYYIDDNPEEIAITVEDFFDFYLYYEQYVKGGRLIYCSECGKLVLDSNTGAGKPTQYCKKCAREKELEKYERYDKKRAK
jgi:hypothetical protein